MALDQPDRLDGVPAREQHARGARQNGRQIAEHEPADEAELGDHEQAVLVRRVPSGRAPARSRSGSCWSSGRSPFGVDVVPDDSRTNAIASGSTGPRRRSRVSAPPPRSSTGISSATDGHDDRHRVAGAAALLHRLLAAEPDQRPRRRIARMRIRSCSVAEQRRHERQHRTAVDARHQRDRRPRSSAGRTGRRHRPGRSRGWRGGPRAPLRHGGVRRTLSVASPQISAGLSGLLAPHVR